MCRALVGLNIVTWLAFERRGIPYGSPPRVSQREALGKSPQGSPPRVSLVSLSTGRKIPHETSACVSCLFIFKAQGTAYVTNTPTSVYTRQAPERRAWAVTQSWHS